MVVLLVLTGYACKKSISATEKTVVLPNVSYTGTGSVTKGLASTTISSLYSCSGGRVTAVGSITSTDGKVWTVPSDFILPLWLMLTA